MSAWDFPVFVFGDIFKARGRASMSTPNVSGQKEQKREGETPTTELKAKTEGGGQKMGVGRN